MKIALVGSHGVGKTSLLSKLQNQLEFEPYEFYEESVHQISRIGFPYNEASSDCSQLAMLALNLLHLQKAEDFISDRCILDIMVYAEVLKNRGSNISQDCVEILRKYWYKYKHLIDLYVFCPIEWEAKDDGFRMTDNYLREMISTLMLAKIYMDLKPEQFLIVRGSTEERCEQVKSYVKASGGIR